MWLDWLKIADKDSIILTVHREGVKEAMELTVSITDVELPYVFHEMLEDQIGYIRITEFAGVTARNSTERLLQIWIPRGWKG